jgi:nitrogen fixation protein NifB
MKIALATSDGETVNRHFGNTPYFVIAEVTPDGFEMLESRENNGGCGLTLKELNINCFDETVALVSDCGAVIAAKIGRAAVSELQRNNIQALEQAGSIESLLARYAKYLGRGGYRPAAPRRSLELEHPCFALGRPNNKGRVHLPVSPGCNIACAFCSRALDADRGVLRPGVTGEVLTPREALDVVRRAVELAPEITVAGIAGPGDTLATPYALDTFRLIKREFPNLLRCMSTNGLLLPEKAGELLEVGIDTLTVTVNAVEPDILKQIVFGVDPETLIRNQLEGIRRVSSAGVTVKVNTVLVPGVNDKHIAEIAKAVSEAGATVYNIIPLIPQNKLSHVREPECDELDAARRGAEPYIRVFRHCQHCRADAVGVPGGRDYGELIYGARAAQENTFSHG